MARDPLSVFINVPFDDAYEPLFEALVFTIAACGYRVRCALEEDDSGDIRMDKLDRLIRESPRSVHDLSRTHVSDGELPRFNMPFELGLAIGAKRFGSKAFKSNTIKIMVAEPYKMPAYLSDLGGNDPSAHKDDPMKVIDIVRKYLHLSPKGELLEGTKQFVAAYADFQKKLPSIASGIGFDRDEVKGFKNYRTFLWCIAEYLKDTGQPPEAT